MKKVLSLILGLALVLSFAGCGGGAPASAGPVSSGEGQPSASLPGAADESPALRLGAEADFKASFEATTLYSDPLVGLDESANAVPWLVADWDINDDATQYTLHLQEGVEFSDGTPFTAEVCRYDIEAVGAVYYCSYLAILKSMEVVDEHTLQVNFTQSNIGFMQDLMKIVALPVGSVSEAGTFVKFVGTGPYILQDYEENVEATLVRNENYWNKDRLPTVAEVKWVVIPGADARVMALESGQVDAIGVTEHGMSVPYSGLVSLESGGNFEIARQSAEAFTSVVSVGMNWTRAPLNDVNLRRALMYAIDRQALVDTIYYGWVDPCGDLTNPSFVDGYAGGEPFTYSPERALEILEEGGYVLEDDVLTKDGAPIELEYLTTTILEDTDLAVFIQAALGEIGITVNITSLDFAQVAEPMHSGDYDLTKGFYWLEPMVGALGMYGLGADYNSMGGAYGGLGYGVTPEITTLGEDMLAAGNAADFKAASDAFWAANYEACPTIPLFTGIRAMVYGAEWTGFTFNYNYLVIDLSSVTRK